jgi:capsular exopolysaccharide synthesis family protein
MVGFGKRKRTEDALEKAIVAGDDPFVVVEKALDPFLVCIHDPEGFRAEQIRGVRNKLTVMNPDGAARTLVITSSVKGEGKTVTAINLAVSFAELELSKVLLIDADLRHPCVERFLGLTPSRGLTELLLGRIGLSEAVRPSGVEGVWVMGAGARPTNPSELLSSRRVDNLFAQLKEDYRYVLLDTPPVIPITDASVLSAKTDGTLLVVRMEHSPRVLVQQAVKTIQELGGNLLGTFLTGVRGADPAADERYAYPVQPAETE